MRTSNWPYDAVMHLWLGLGSIQLEFPHLTWSLVFIVLNIWNKGWHQGCPRCYTCAIRVCVPQPHSRAANCFGPGTKIYPGGKEPGRHPSHIHTLERFSHCPGVDSAAVLEHTGRKPSMGCGLWVSSLEDSTEVVLLPLHHRVQWSIISLF